MTVSPWRVIIAVHLTFNGGLIMHRAMTQTLKDGVFAIKIALTTFIEMRNSGKWDAIEKDLIQRKKGGQVVKVQVWAKGNPEEVCLKTGKTKSNGKAA